MKAVFHLHRILNWKNISPLRKCKVYSASHKVLSQEAGEDALYLFLILASHHLTFPSSWTHHSL